MKNLDQIRLLLKLKEVERYSTVKNRKESSAEHSWATIIIAKYFLKKITEPIN
jgi:putative hydrolase of HD superfamily